MPPAQGVCAMANPAAGTASLPEEILEKIISLALSSEREKAQQRLPLMLLLVCKSFERLAKPIIYSVLHLQSREQAEKLAGTLANQPALWSYVRGIRVDAPSAGTALQTAVNALALRRPPQVIDFLDVNLVDERIGSDVRQCRQDVQVFCAALRQCPDTRVLIIRQGLYVRQQAVASFMGALAECVRRAANLEAVDFRYRPTPLPAPSGVQQSDPFAAALAAAPRLKVVRAVRPTLLNAFLLDVAENPALERVDLVEPNDTRPPLRASEDDRRTHDASVERRLLETATEEIEAMPSTLFSSQLSAHPRLHALVRAGYLHTICERLRRRTNAQR